VSTHLLLICGPCCFIPPVELVGLAVAVVPQDLDVVEHGLDDLLVNSLQLALDLKKLGRFINEKIIVAA
jgi:hypothetical protein